MSLTASEISRLLAEQSRRVAEYLLPIGKMTSAGWQAGNVEGEPGKSLRVCVSGDLNGKWTDFATGEGGDLLDLWAATRLINLSEAMKEAKQFLGVQADRDLRVSKHDFAKPELPINSKKIFDNVKAEIYLLYDRKLKRETIEHFMIQANDEEIIFPFYRDGKLLGLKYLAIERPNGKKIMRTEKNCEPTLFGWHAIDPGTRSIVICEGEIDAMTLWQYGHNALSVPFGAGIGNKQSWLENDFERLSVFDEIYICFDNDEAGQKPIDEIVMRLGSHRCRVVKLPLKDANECLQSGLTKDEINCYFLNSKNFDPVELKRPSAFLEQTLQEIFFNDAMSVGVELPFSKSKGKILFRPQELTLWNGINGHGKSQMLGQVALHAMSQGSQVCIASLELHPRKLLHRLSRQAGAIKDLSEDYTKAIFEWYEDKLLIFDLLGTANQDKLIEIFLYARKRYGVDVFIIDSLMKCGIGEDDYNAQKLFVEKLCNFKNQYDCHVHLVVHPRKGLNEDEPPGKMDIKGTGSLSDLADNVLSVWRNKPKEKEITVLRNESLPVSEEVNNKPDCILRCDKQRNGDWEGMFYLWFDKKSFQFLNDRHTGPTSYVDFYKPQ